MEVLENRLGQVNDPESQIAAIIRLTKDILGEMSDYETGMIRDSIRMISMEAPSTKLLVTERINKLNQCKSELQYIVLKAKEVRRTYNIPFVNSYNTYFTLGTKKGLPSKQAIESEMYHVHADMRERRDKLEDIDNLLEFLSSYFGLIDRTISTLESRRYDL
jgi:hypothetical protein